MYHVKVTNNAWKLLLRIAVSLVIVVFMAAKYDWSKLWGGILGADLRWLCPVVLTVFLVHLIGACRWKLLYPPASIKELLGIIYLSRLFSTVLPGQLFGEAAKVIYLNTQMKKCGVDADVEKITASVIMDKLTGFLSLFVIGILGIAASSIKDTAAVLTLVFFLSVTIASACVLGLPKMDKLLINLDNIIGIRLKWAGRIIRRVQIFLECWRSYLGRPSRLGLCMGLSFVFQFLGALNEYMVGKAVGFYVPLTDWCWIFAILSIILLLPISIAGLGVREASLVGMLALFGVNAVDAITCSLLLLGCQLMDSGIGAIILMAGWTTGGKRKDKEDKNVF